MSSNRRSGNAVKQGYGRVVAGPVYGSLADDAKGSHDMTSSPAASACSSAPATTTAPIC